MTSFPRRGNQTIRDRINKYSSTKHDPRYRLTDNLQLVLDRRDVDSRCILFGLLGQVAEDGNYGHHHGAAETDYQSKLPF